VQQAQGNLPAALQSYRDSLAIRDRLAKSDPGNAGWQRDLSVSFNNVGDVQQAQGNLPAALQSYRDGLTIRDQLAKTDPGNARWQRDLAISFDKGLAETIERIRWRLWHGQVNALWISSPKPSLQWTLQPTIGRRLLPPHAR
jgi:hypothetical protein